MRISSADTLAGRAAAARYFLSDADRDEQVEIPAEVHRVLRQVVDAMGQGLPR